MLRNLHIKNLALIREIDVDFAEGLNILTGETGAGKSIIIDSISLALGGKAVRNLLREDAPYGLVELVFEETDPEVLEALKALDVETEEGVVLISRKLQGSRSTCRINGESRTAADVRAVGALLLDIHGQSEHQKLLKPEHQLALIDAYGRAAIAPVKAKVAEKYRQYAEIRRQLGGGDMSAEERARNISFLQFEVDEINDANLTPGEDEELEKSYRRMVNSRRIVESAVHAHELTGYDSDEGAGESIGLAVRELDRICEYDPDAAEMLNAISEIEDLLGDFNRALADYIDGLSFEEETFRETEERLDLINRLKAKYGRTIEDILKAKADKEAALEELMNYEEDRARLKKALARVTGELTDLSDELTEARKKTAAVFSQEVMKQLRDLNFARADFDVAFRENESFSANGRDAVDFMIATNPGESLRVLTKVVSGGELSRIMLGIKTMFAQGDKTDTLIFDEVDTGISGRTAQKVAEKMAVIASSRQVLCITHLPQIAAMADTHYGITKDLTDEAAITRIEPLDEEESVRELARLLGGARITDNTISSAREMKDMSRAFREKVRA